MKSNWIKKTAALACFGFTVCYLAHADEIYTSSNYQIILSGDFNHSKLQDATISGAPAGKENLFRWEIFGNQFTLSIPDLTSGKYQVILGFVENYSDHPGGRLFDITCGNQIIAHDLDIFAVSGGQGKVFYLTNEVDFERGATNQPLTLAFTASENNAKFNTFELRDISNHPLIFADANDFASGYPDDPVALKIPIMAGPQIWKDDSQPLDARIKDLISRLSLAEKVSQLSCEAPA
ncbi:MAG TPA: malectin domain-containing carbohydrate-binding protein, partial [Candidatus Acidoferrum sp.]|nr:malectin domain-containing carbohydrate-binding protein [Candidatus Acidoferrum sp.]